jgi:CDP-diacylglycerol pyrophosphatase
VIVHGICVPNWQQQHRPDPCASVDLRSGIDQGTAALINPMAKSEALVVPTRPISGIESPDLLQDDAPDLFGAAWNARHLVFHRLGKTLPRDGIGLAINSQLSRSQDLAHIHVDCLRLDVRDELERRARDFAVGWLPDPIVFDGTPYRALRIDAADLTNVNPFRLVADGLKGARGSMTRATIVVVGVTFAEARDGFIVLVNFADGPKGNAAYGEELLDHSCALAQQS